MAVLIWLGLLVLFLVVEAACLVHLVCIWFAVGALAAAVVAMLHGAVWLQIGVFFAVSGALLALLWPVVKKFVNPRLTATNVDSVIGQQGYVTGEIDNLNARGTVKIAGMEWTARSANGHTIPEGAVVKVDRIEGVKAIVSLAEETCNAE